MSLLFFHFDARKEIVPGDLVTNEFRWGVALISSFIDRLPRHGRSRVTCSRTGRVLRRLSAGLAVLALALSAAAGAAQAAIVFSDTSNLTTPWFQLSSGGDVALTGNNAFTVTAGTGSSVLVVPYDEYAQSNTGLDATPTIKWITSAGTQTLQLAASLVSSNSSYVYSQVYYLYNPNVGTGAITLSGSGRSYAMNAYTLSGVNTGGAPAAYVATSTTTTPTSLTLANSTIANSFAATAQAFRFGTLPLSFTFTSGTGSLAWSRSDANENQVYFAAGYVNGLSAGTTTITSQPNTISTRNVLAAAVFTPNIGTLTWAGSAGNGKWDVAATANWRNPNTLGYYIEPNNGVLFDDSAGTAGGTTNVVVTQAVAPQSIAFNNTAYAYTLTASGGGAIGGSGAVALSGSGLVALNMANTYSGGTTVSAGTLSIGNANGSATGSGPVVIAAGATLTGSGSISTSGTGAVTVNGSIRPDASPGVYNTLSASALNFNSGSTLNLNFNTPSAGQHDLINVSGSLALTSGTVNVNVANLSGTWAVGAYPFVNYGTLSGSPTFNLVNTFVRSARRR